MNLNPKKRPLLSTRIFFPPTLVLGVILGSFHGSYAPLTKGWHETTAYCAFSNETN